MTEMINQSDTSGEFSSSELAKQLEAPAAPTPEAYRAQAEDIFGTIDRFKDKLGIRGAYEAAREAYVDQEDNPYLAHLSTVLLRAPNMYGYSTRLNELEGKTEHTNDERGQAQQLRYACIEYNHAIRALVVQSGDNIARGDLENWLEKACQGRSGWVRGPLILGVAAEVAAYKALAEVKTVRRLRFGSVEEDVHGIDILAEGEQGDVYGFDVKSGNQRLDEHMTFRKINRGVPILELPIATASVKGFELSLEAASALAEDVRQLMQHKAA